MLRDLRGESMGSAEDCVGPREQYLRCQDVAAAPLEAVDTPTDRLTYNSPCRSNGYNTESSYAG